MREITKPFSFLSIFLFLYTAAFMAAFYRVTEGVFILTQNHILALVLGFIYFIIGIRFGIELAIKIFIDE